MHGALEIPAGDATLRIDLADLVATRRVITSGREMSDQATSRDRIQRRALALGQDRALSVGPLDTGCIPGHDAAEGIVAADLQAAIAVGTAGQLVNLEATFCIGSAADAGNGRTIRDRKLGAHLVPRHLAAERGRRAHQGATRPITAEWGIVGNAAVARKFGSTADLGTLCGGDLHAIDVPGHLAASDIQRTGPQATSLIRAIRLLMRQET